MKIDYVEFSSAQDNVPQPKSFQDWEALVAYFSVFHAGPKASSPLWSPVTYQPEATRGNRGIESVNAAVFDVDHATDEQIRELLARLTPASFLMHSTYSDSPDNRCFRLIFPLDAPVKPLQWRNKTRQAFIDQYEIPADPATKDPARIYYLPTSPVGKTGTLYAGKGMSWTPAQERLLASRTTNKELAKRIAYGLPLSKPGARNADINKAAWLLLGTFPELDDAAIVALVTPALRAMPSDKPFEEELELFQRKLDGARARKPEVDAEKQGEDLGNVFAPIAIPTIAPQELNSVNPRHLIIQKDSSYFFKTKDDYTGPFGSESADSAMRQELAPFGLNFRAISKAGPGRLLTVKELIATNGMVAHRLEGSLFVPKSYFDQTTMTFVEAVAPLRPLAPVQHQDVHDWLLALGGEKSDKLLDWVASVTKLQHQCAGLLLEGDAGSGKTLLANGLASLWTKAGPSPFDVLTGDFNSLIKTCPLVFADEGFSVPRNGNINDILRRAIASPSFNLKRKFISDVSVQGAIRVMMATNNANILADFQDVGADDRDGLMARILLIGVHDGKARGILSGMPHEDKAAWKEFMIAEHALYLRDTRKVVHGPRFIVEGEGTEVTDRLSVSAGVAPDMIEFIVTAVKDKSNPDYGQDVKAGGGKLLVSARLFRSMNADKFKNATGNSKLPSTYLANQTLANISSGEVQIAGRTFFDIKLNFLTAWNKTARSDNFNAVLAQVMK